MSVVVDPEGNETRALLALEELKGRRVLEIGSGQGRLTWRYAHLAAHVTAIEPFEPHLVQAAKALPAELRGRVHFRNRKFEDFSATSPSSSYDVAILSWSL